MLVRAISGLVFVCIVIGSIMFGASTFVLLFSVVAAIALHEFYNTVQKTNTAQFYIIDKLAIGAGFISVLLAGNLFFQDLNVEIAFVIPVLLVLPLVLSVFTKMENGVRTIAHLYMGYGWVVFSFLMLFAWAYINGKYNYTYFIWGIVFIWTNDVFAYLTGRLIGKTKLFERVSPNKTWEGTLGGLVFASTAGILVAYIFDYSIMPWLGFGLLCGVCATVGDLFESVIKRSLGVKDMGKIMPGHGGMLDRFDALMFAAPFGAAYIQLVMV